MASTSLPVFLHLLANRKLTPGALQLVFEPAAADALSQLATLPDFAALVGEVSTFVGEPSTHDLPEPTLQALLQLGCQTLNPGLIHHSDGAARPELPAASVWLDGHWYLAAPARPQGAQASSRTLALKLLQLVMADAETRDIEDILRQDPTLSYHLLRLVNSLGMGLSRRITSFSQAILILGRNQLRRWLNLMLFAARSDDHRGAMLLAKVSARSRAMELLAKEAGLDRADQELAFMAGMFSMLGVLFGTPLPELIKPLQLSDELLAALLEQQGEIGRLLQLQELTGQCQSTAVAAMLAELHLSADAFNLCTVQATRWMLGIAREMQGAGHG